MEKSLWMISITHMFIEVYLLMQVALIPVVIREFQLSLVEASLIAAVPTFVALMMNIPSGFLADKFSTNKLLFTSMLIEGVAAILVSQSNSFWMLVLGVSFLKVSSPVYHISGLSQLSRRAKPGNIGRSIGFHNALGNVGTAAGLVSLTVFLSTLGWRWTYIFWTVPVTVWGILLLTSKELRTKRVEKTDIPSKNSLKRFSFILSVPVIIFLVAISIREVGGTGCYTYMTTYFTEARGLSEATASFVFALGPFIGIIGSLGGGYFAERTGAKKALMWTILACALSLSVLSLQSEFYLLTLAFLVYTAFSNMLWSPMNMMVATLTPSTERGLSYSLYFFTEGLIASITPTLVAAIVELTYIWIIFPFSAAFFVASAIALQFVSLQKQE